MQVCSELVVVQWMDGKDGLVLLVMVVMCLVLVRLLRRQTAAESASLDGSLAQMLQVHCHCSFASWDITR